MGRLKEWINQQEAQGFESINSRVCTGCIDDDALQDFIKREGIEGHSCSYCEPDSTDKKTVTFDEFAIRFLEGLESEWGEPNDEGVGWDGGWTEDVIDTWDILNGELDLDFSTEQLKEDVQRSLGDRQWCQKNVYELKPHEALSLGWEEFTKVVKHESRYLFFRREDTRADSRGMEEIAPADFLDALGSAISKCKLYRKLEAGTQIQRLRLHDHGKSFTKALDLGAPVPEKAMYANRMSAAGIPAFYGAFDKETAIAETTSAARVKQSATIGHFELLRDLNVVDFTKLPPSPSIFSPGTRSIRQGIAFLRSFLRDFTAPIAKDGREHIDYVPTQVVAEFLRFVHRGPKKQQIDGIIYESARKDGAHACVLFIGAEGSGDPGEKGSKQILTLAKVETFKL